MLLCAGLIAHALTKPIRGKWILRFMILLPWAAPVPLSTIGWLWIYDSLLSVVNWTLTHDLLAGPGEFYLYKVVNAVTPWTIEPFNPPQWLGDPTLALGAVISVHAWRIIPSRSSSSSRASRRSPPRSRTRPRSTGQRACASSGT